MMRLEDFVLAAGDSVSDAGDSSYLASGGNSPEYLY